MGISPNIFYKVHYIEQGGDYLLPPFSQERRKSIEDKTLETDAEKIARIERALEEKDATIKKLTEDNELLSKKINSLKIDGLVKQVEPKVLKEEPEEIEFDFDL